MTVTVFQNLLLIKSSFNFLLKDDFFSFLTLLQTRNIVEQTVSFLDPISPSFFFCVFTFLKKHKPVTILSLTQFFCSCSGIRTSGISSQQKLHHLFRYFIIFMVNCHQHLSMKAAIFMNDYAAYQRGARVQ